MIAAGLNFLLSFCSITQYCEERLQTVDEVVQEMRKIVEEETNLTVSAGIAPNKVITIVLRSLDITNSRVQDAR